MVIQWLKNLCLFGIFPQVSIFNVQIYIAVFEFLTWPYMTFVNLPSTTCLKWVSSISKEARYNEIISSGLAGSVATRINLWPAYSIVFGMKHSASNPCLAKCLSFSSNFSKVIKKFFQEHSWFVYLQCGHNILQSLFSEYD